MMAISTTITTVFICIFSTSILIPLTESKKCKTYSDCEPCKPGNYPAAANIMDRECINQNAQGEGTCTCVRQKCDEASTCPKCYTYQKRDVESVPYYPKCRNNECYCEIYVYKGRDCKSYKDCTPCKPGNYAGAANIMDRSCTDRNSAGEGFCKCVRQKCEKDSDCPDCYNPDIISYREVQRLEYRRTCKDKKCYCEQKKCSSKNDCTSCIRQHDAVAECSETPSSHGKKICHCQICRPHLRAPGVCPDICPPKRARFCPAFKTGGDTGVCSCFHEKICFNGRGCEESKCEKCRCCKDTCTVTIFHLNDQSPDIVNCG